MKILFLASEIAPFSRTGEIGDFCQKLPSALKKMGHDVRVVTPQYRSIGDRKFGLRDVARLRNLDFEIGPQSFTCSVKSGFIPKSKVQVYFVRNYDYYNRNGIYKDKETGETWSDAHLRFGFLNYASLNLLFLLQWQPDIIHCNDWFTGLVPLLIKQNDSFRDYFKHTRTVFQIHNVDRLCQFPISSCEELGIIEKQLPKNKIKSGVFSFYEIGIENADRIILDHSVKMPPDEKNRLLEFMNTPAGKKDDENDVYCGLDREWNPDINKGLIINYNEKTYKEGKRIHRKHIAEKYNIAFDSNTPLLLVDLDMIDRNIATIIQDNKEKIFKLSFKWAAVCREENGLFSILKEIEKEYPQKFTIIRLDDFAGECSLFYAASDFSLITADNDKDLSPLICLKFGSAALISKECFWANAITDFFNDAESGNGFLLDLTDANSVLDLLKCIEEIYLEKRIFRKLQINCLQDDPSWNYCAEKITKIYEETLNRIGLVS